MFLCAKCTEARGAHERMAKSFGPCEGCGAPALCNDIPSSQLPAQNVDEAGESG